MNNYTPPPMPGFPPPPAPKKPRTNAIIIGSAAAAIAVIVITGAAIANSDSSSSAQPSPTVTVTETTAMTDQEILDRSMEIVESAEADVDAGVEPDVTIPEVATESDEPAGPLTSIEPGTYLVGEDVKSGSYKTSGPSGSSCYWARNKDDSGELEAIIANDLLEGPGRVTLKKGEVFDTSGCEAWELAE